MQDSNEPIQVTIDPVPWLRAICGAANCVGIIERYRKKIPPEFLGMLAQVPQKSFQNGLEVRLCPAPEVEKVVELLGQIEKLYGELTDIVNFRLPAPRL